MFSFVCLVHVCVCRQVRLSISCTCVCMWTSRVVYLVHMCVCGQVGLSILCTCVFADKWGRLSCTCVCMQTSGVREQFSEVNFLLPHVIRVRAECPSLVNHPASLPPRPAIAIAWVLCTLAHYFPSASVY